MVLKNVQTGTGGLRNFHKGDPFQRGSGLFSFFGRLLKKAVPAVKSLFSSAKTGVKEAAKAAIKSQTAQNLKDLALETTGQLAIDALTGKDPSSTLQSAVGEAKGEVASALKEQIDRRRLKRTAANFKSSKKKKKKKKKNADTIENESGSYELFDS